MEFYISDDKGLLDFDRVHKEVKDSYWGGYRTKEMTLTTIENSWCFGIYSKNEGQVGFARLITDKLVFAYIMDVIIFDPFKGKGLGKMLMEHILENSEIKQVQTVALKTKDAHGLYEAFGFQKVGDSEMWMAKDKAKYD